MATFDGPFLFDASIYPGFEKAKELDRRLRRPDQVWIKGVGALAIFIAIIAWFAYSGVAGEQPVLFVIAIAIAIVVAATLASMLFVAPGSPKIPVRISSDGYLLIGDRSWAVPRIGKLTAFGARGNVEIRERDGTVIAVPYRAQFGSYEDFVKTILTLQPDIEVTRDTTNVKVRLPKDSI